MTDASDNKIKFLINSIEKLADNKTTFQPVKLNLANFINPLSLSNSSTPDMLSVLISRIFTALPKFPDWELCPELEEPPSSILTIVPPPASSFNFETKKNIPENLNQQLLPPSMTNKKNTFNSPINKGTPLLPPSRGSITRSAAIKQPSSSFNPTYTNLDLIENSDFFSKQSAKCIIDVASWVSKWIKYYSSLPEGEKTKRHLINYNNINTIFDTISSYIQRLKPWLSHFQLSNATFHQISVSIRRSFFNMH